MTNLSYDLTVARDTGMDVIRKLASFMGWLAEDQPRAFNGARLA